MPEAASRVRADFAAKHGDNQVRDQFERAIRERCRWTLGSVFGGHGR
jgi:hypothetical protein